MLKRTRRIHKAGFLAAAIVVPFALVAAAEGKRPFTIEDLYRIKGVADPAVSPDGRTIVYTVTTSDLAAVKRTVNIWRVDPDGKGDRPLTASEARDESPQFSPDGKTLAFVSTRAGDPQLYLIPTSGGEAEKKTDFPGGIAGPGGRETADGSPLRLTSTPNAGRTPLATASWTTRARRASSRPTSQTRCSTATGTPGRTASGAISSSSTFRTRRPGCGT